MKKASEIELKEVISNSLEINNFEAVFNVPGFGGTDVLETLKKRGKVKTFVNLNEEAAFSISYGVSSNGKRSATLVKSQGFAKALNAVTSSLSTETISANLIFIFDDSEGRSSDNVLPTKNIIKSSEIPFEVLAKEPSKQIAQAIQTSEKLKIPFALIVDCKHLQKKFKPNVKKVFVKKTVAPSYLDRLACPILTRYQREKLKSKLKGIKPKISVPEIRDIRKVLPSKLLEEFTKYEKFMNIFKKLRPSFVSGDAGTSALFAFPPFNCVDSCTYMGGGPGMALGASIAGVRDAVCITGDFSFLAAGILGFNEGIIHKMPLKIIIFSNGKAHATGGQEINPDLLDGFRRSFHESITTIKLAQEEDEKIQSLLSSFLRKDKLSILILEI